MQQQPSQPPQTELFNEQGQKIKVDRVHYNQRWNEIWDANLKPGQLFDASTSSPVLKHALTVDDQVDCQGKRALVPGCGYEPSTPILMMGVYVFLNGCSDTMRRRGYDLATLAQAGCSAAVGLDLAPAAVGVGCTMTLCLSTNKQPPTLLYHYVCVCTTQARCTQVDVAVKWLDNDSGLSPEHRAACRVEAADFFSYTDSQVCVHMVRG